MLREEEVAGTCKLLVLQGPRGPGPKASLAGQGALLPEASVPRSWAPRCQAPPLPAKGWWWKRAELSQHQAGGWRKGPHPCLVRVGRESSPEHLLPAGGPPRFAFPRWRWTIQVLYASVGPLT